MKMEPHTVTQFTWNNCFRNKLYSNTYIEPLKVTKFWSNLKPKKLSHIPSYKWRHNVRKLYASPPSLALFTSGMTNLLRQWLKCVEAFDDMLYVERLGGCRVLRLFLTSFCSLSHVFKAIFRRSVSKRETFSILGIDLNKGERRASFGRMCHHCLCLPPSFPSATHVASNIYLAFLLSVP